MTEQQIQSKIIKYIEKELHGYVVKVISASRSGVPDLLACVEGKFLGIEVKKPTTKSNVSKLQAYNIDKIEEADGIAFVAWDIESLEENLREYGVIL